MKRLVDNTEVTSRSYYYLLDWNDRDQHKYIFKTFNEYRLCDLNIEQYTKLFKHATETDLQNGFKF